MTEIRVPIIDVTQKATDELLRWIDGADLPQWVERELRESLEYMMELHNAKQSRLSQMGKK